MKTTFLYLGMLSGLALPLMNIPLILKIRKNRSSKDLSLIWAWGVWICIILMLPQALLTEDLVLKIFGILNFVIFSFVVVYVCYYRKRH